MSVDRSKKIKRVRAIVVEQKNTNNYKMHFHDGKKLWLVRSHLNFDDFERSDDVFTYCEQFVYEKMSGQLEIIIRQKDIEWCTYFLEPKDYIYIKGERDDFFVAIPVPLKPLPYKYDRKSTIARVKLSLSGKEDALIKINDKIIDELTPDSKEENTEKDESRLQEKEREEKKKKEKAKKKEKQQGKKKNTEKSQKTETLFERKEKEGLSQKLSLALSQRQTSEEIQPEKKEDLERSKKDDSPIVDLPFELLDKTESAEFLIFIQDENGIEDYYVIHKTPTLHKPREHMLFYSTLQARETMSAAFRPERDGRGKYANNEFSVTGIVYKTGDEVAYTTVAKEIVIRSGGGKNTSVVSNNFKVIDLLLFSPKTNRYEIIKATHDAANEVCFIDLAIYKVFVKHFGNPGLPYRFGDGSGEAIDNDGLNAESVLKSFGYSVAQNVGLSDKQRQDILADVVDLGMLSVSKVIWYLELFIRLHPGSRFYSAREKWERDEYFIANYSENPERFYIT